MPIDPTRVAANAVRFATIRANQAQIKALKARQGVLLDTVAVFRPEYNAIEAEIGQLMLANHRLMWPHLAQEG